MISKMANLKKVVDIKSKMSFVFIPDADMICCRVKRRVSLNRVGRFYIVLVDVEVIGFVCIIIMIKGGGLSLHKTSGWICVLN